MRNSRLSSLHITSRSRHQELKMCLLLCVYVMYDGEFPPVYTSNLYTKSHLCQRQSNILYLFLLYSLGSGSTLALLCSQMQSSSPSLFLLIVPLKAHNLFPTCKISQCMSTSMPAGIGRMYVVFKVRLTPIICQKPGLLTSARTVEVQKSRRVAAAPPWRLPKPLVCSS
jgi:hypothetical protein